MKLICVITGLVATAFAIPRQSLRLRDVDPCDYIGQSCDPDSDQFPHCCINTVLLAKCDSQNNGSFVVDTQNCIGGCVSNDDGDHCAPDN